MINLSGYLSAIAKNKVIHETEEKTVVDAAAMEQHELFDLPRVCEMVRILYLHMEIISQAADFEDEGLANRLIATATRALDRIQEITDDGLRDYEMNTRRPALKHEENDED